jgi:hypothetical protein
MEVSCIIWNYVVNRVISRVFCGRVGKDGSLNFLHKGDLF